MYIEIGKRGSGKTTRLVKAIIEHLSSPGNRAIIICKNQGVYQYASDECKKASLLISGRFTRIYSMKFARGIDFTKVKLFVDNADDYKVGELFAVDNGYYTAREKNEVVKQLILANAGKYEYYPGGIDAPDAQRFEKAVR
jgi:hypothetical protein